MSEYSHYEIDQEKCTKCGECAKNCPSNAIPGEVGKHFEIDQNLCIQCGICFDVCSYDAIKRS